MGLTAKARTFVAVSPLLIPVHVSALSVERKTPPPCVPTNTWPIEFLANAMPSPPCGPFVCIQKFCPPGESARVALCDRGTPAADFVRGNRPAELENTLDARATRIVPDTKTDRLIRRRRLGDAETL